MSHVTESVAHRGDSVSRGPWGTMMGARVSVGLITRDVWGTVMGSL